MEKVRKIPTWHYHCFLDEAGDTTFYGKGKTPILGSAGVSKCFILGMLKFKEPLDDVRKKVLHLQEKISRDRYFAGVCSIAKKKATRGYYLHATDDVPEVRKMMFELIDSLECSFEAVVARKDYLLFERKHNGRNAEFYADLLSHLIGNEFVKHPRINLVIAKRSQSTGHKNLDFGLQKAVARLRQNDPTAPHGQVTFDVQHTLTEPLLNVADYFCWAVQRVFEKGETRFYDYLKDKIELIVDLFGSNAGYQNPANFFSKEKPLTIKNWIK